MTRISKKISTDYLVCVYVFFVIISCQIGQLNFALLYRISVIKAFGYTHSRCQPIILFVETPKINLFQIDRCIYMWDKTKKKRERRTSRNDSSTVDDRDQIRQNRLVFFFLLFHHITLSKHVFLIKNKFSLMIIVFFFAFITSMSYVSFRPINSFV